MSTNTLDLGEAALLIALDRLLHVPDTVAGQIKQVEAETLGHAVIGVRRNVYDTARGAYTRTEDLLRGMTSTSSASSKTLTVTIGNTEPYAVNVELGEAPNDLSPTQDQAYSAANRNPTQPISFGRSGRAYTIAGPFIAPAQAYSLYRMQQLFAQAVTAAARR